MCIRDSVGDHSGGMELAGGDHVQRLDHVAGVAAGGAHQMVRGVMHVVEVEHGGQVGVGGAGEEVQATVEGQNLVALLDDGSHGSEHQHVVVTLVVGQRHELAHGILAGGVQINQLHAVGGGVFHGVDGSGAVQTGLVDVGYHQHAGLAVAMDGVVDGAQTHGARAGQDGHVAAFDDAHFMGRCV